MDGAYYYCVALRRHPQSGSWSSVTAGLGLWVMGVSFEPSEFITKISALPSRVL